MKTEFLALFILLAVPAFGQVKLAPKIDSKQVNIDNTLWYGTKLIILGGSNFWEVEAKLLCTPFLIFYQITEDPPFHFKIYISHNYCFVYEVQLLWYMVMIHIFKCKLDEWYTDDCSSQSNCTPFEVLEFSIAQLKVT